MMGSFLIENDGFITIINNIITPKVLQMRYLSIELESGAPGINYKDAKILIKGFS